MNGMDPIIADIRNCIERYLDRGKYGFIIFPYGDIGIKVKSILNNAYGIMEKYLIDNHLCKYNDEIRGISELDSLDYKDTVVILDQLTIKYMKNLRMP